METTVMREHATNMPLILTVSALIFTAVSCTERPSAQQRPDEIAAVLVEQDDAGNVVVRLTDKSDGGVWRLKDERHDIVVREQDDVLNIELTLPTPSGGLQQVKTSIKRLPGEKKILVGGADDAKIYVQLPKTGLPNE